MSLRPERRVSDQVQLTLDIPAARGRSWTVLAAVMGVPWLLLTVVASVWYLGWGMPDGWFLRVLVWIVAMTLFAALHALALLSVWGAAYARNGTETVLIDAERITVIRRAGRVPLSVHIRRGLVESARLLPARAGHATHPRIEVRSWRGAIRFGAGFTADEAGECVEALKEFFTRAAAAREAR